MNKPSTPFFIHSAFFCFVLFAVNAQNVPADYKLLYQEDFEEKPSAERFEFTDSTAWAVKEGALELHGKSDYNPPFRSPHNIAIVKDLRPGSFILEADLRQTGKEYGHRDLCLFFNMKDPANFYYVHMASVADPHAHNVFLVNDAERTAIADKTTQGVQWGQTTHKVRLERNMETGTIKVFFDDMNTPVMEAKDNHFGKGYIGFGSFDDTGRFDNIKIWGPEQTPEQKGFFKQKEN